MNSGATFSEDRYYRYQLWRKWGEGPILNTICLNPSTADELANDPTVTRQIRRAQKMGFAGFVMTNIFAWRSTDPKGLTQTIDPVGPDNDNHLLSVARGSTLVVCAWGSRGPHKGEFKDRGSRVLRMLRDDGINTHAFKVTNGIPWHPLYLSYDLKPFEWTDSTEPHLVERSKTDLQVQAD